MGFMVNEIFMHNNNNNHWLINIYIYVFFDLIIWLILIREEEKWMYFALTFWNIWNPKYITMIN